MTAHQCHLFHFKLLEHKAVTGFPCLPGPCHPSVPRLGDTPSPRVGAVVLGLSSLEYLVNIQHVLLFGSYPVSCPGGMCVLEEYGGWEFLPELSTLWVTKCKKRKEGRRRRLRANGPFWGTWKQYVLRSSPGPKAACGSALHPDPPQRSFLGLSVTRKPGVQSKGAGRRPPLLT